MLQRRKTMGKEIIDQLVYYGSSGKLNIRPDDTISKRLAMLIDSKCHGLGPRKAAQKYGYSITRYFQLQRAYKEGGAEALKDKKKGPRRNYVRTDVIENQIIRHRFLDPDAPSCVISQRLNQSGYKVSQRSVERTITKYGIQKKSSIHSIHKKK